MLEINNHSHHIARLLLRNQYNLSRAHASETIKLLRLAEFHQPHRLGVKGPRVSSWPDQPYAWFRRLGRCRPSGRRQCLSRKDRTSSALLQSRHRLRDILRLCHLHAVLCSGHRCGNHNSNRVSQMPPEKAPRRTQEASERLTKCTVCLFTNSGIKPLDPARPPPHSWRP